MIKAILIDIDDTLLDFNAYIKDSLKTGFEHFGLRPYEDWIFGVFKRENGKIWQMMEAGLTDRNYLTQNRFNIIFREIGGIDFDGVEFEHYFKGRLFDWGVTTEGAEETIRYLYPKYKLCIASNGPGLQQRNRVKCSGLADYFCEYFISEEVKAYKPNKPFFDVCKQRLGLESDELLMVGDSPDADICGAIDNGIKTCFMNTNNLTMPEGYTPDWTIKKLPELMDIL